METVETNEVKFTDAHREFESSEVRSMPYLWSAHRLDHFYSEESVSLPDLYLCYSINGESRL